MATLNPTNVLASSYTMEMSKIQWQSSKTFKNNKTPYSQTNVPNKYLA